MVSLHLRQAVRERAENCCEYCQKRQEESPLITFHIEHIVPRKHGGSDNWDNLCLACADCNLKKSSNIAGLDPQSGQLTPLFHPRKNHWEDHLTWEGLRIAGTTDVGRTTIYVLELNSSSRIRVRLAQSTG